VASSCCGTYPAIQWTLGTLNSVLVLLWSALCLVLQPHASHISHLLFAAGEFEPIEGMTGQLQVRPARRCDYHCDFIRCGVFPVVGGWCKQLNFVYIL
jgi:hypothetical protein